MTEADPPNVRQGWKRDLTRFSVLVISVLSERLEMPVGLAVGGIAFGVAAWAILALWMPDASLFYLLRTFEPQAALSIAWVAIIITMTHLMALFVGERLQSRLWLFSAILPLVVLGACSALILARLIDHRISLSIIPADIIAINVADAAVMLSAALLFSASSLGLRNFQKSRRS
ncbi:hypothetical protein D3C85_1275340 [compost metagenome]